MMLLTEMGEMGRLRPPLSGSAILTLLHHMSVLDERGAAGGELPRLIREALGSLAVSDPRTGGSACRSAQLDPISSFLRSSNPALPPEKRPVPRIQLGKRTG
jgi:hypothetical protein